MNKLTVILLKYAQSFLEKNLLLLLTLGVLCQCKDEEFENIHSGKLIEIQSSTKTTITYDENNLITQVSFGNGFLGTISLTYLNEQLVDLIYMSNGETLPHFTFNYENGRLLYSIRHPHPFWPIKTISTYHYNGNSQIIMVNDSVGGYPPTEPWTVSTTSFEYDEVGNLTRSVRSDSTGDVLEEKLYKYDSSNNPLFRKLFYLDHNLEFSLITSINNTTEIVTNNKSDSSTVLYEYQYDNLNYPVMVSRRADGFIYRYDFIYEK